MRIKNIVAKEMDFNSAYNQMIEELKLHNFDRSRIPLFKKEAIIAKWNRELEQGADKVIEIFYGINYHRIEINILLK